MIFIWYILNNKCLVTDWEYELLDMKTPENKLNFTSNFMISIFGEKFKYILYILFASPIINTYVCLYKIYYIYYKNIKKCKK